MNNTQFQVGKTYFCRSVCDYNCIWKFTVIARTERQITLRDEQGKEFRKGVKVANGAEFVLPLGSYSMAPALTSDKIAA